MWDKAKHTRRCDTDTTNYTTLHWALPQHYTTTTHVHDIPHHPPQRHTTETSMAPGSQEELPSSRT
eukprot:CAMPEP_0175890232 /NCGR_PEP_ID=MMETSP0107_2-20121207/47706_1 /TAXON_ID=195067 ORGANISM="Goniomonas pacifica, Strain CCMP1869" /NCGR_SAMPLE_ID=MMETSP0107_2 /ASSEMBLY_ACC=CAM_ASM_000203 /LENGTH=65 /DNA_ID=CAMNT_0017210959 /DNA_START=48 /DNA_END=242 /DNA_ORIENTATION=+